MTKQELIEWSIKIGYTDYRKEIRGGDKWEYTYYDVDGEWFEITWFNNQPWPDSGVGWINYDSYSPKRVKKHVELVEHVTYISA